MGTRLKQGLRLLYVKKPGRFDPGEPGERLPEAYRKFWHEWKVQKPQPVHYIPEPGKWKRNPKTGEVTPVQNVPIPVKFPLESQRHLWGGEGVIKGFQKRAPTARRVAHFWVPTLRRSVVYSEILDTHTSVVVTQRTIDLIHKNYGFDHYILKTPACDLQSRLAVKFKRNMLLALDQKNFYHDDPEKQEEVYNRYKDYLKPYSKEDLEWYGLSFYEALKKLARQEEEQNQPKPLKLQYRLELVQMLLERSASGEPLSIADDVQETSSWLSKLNPFGGKTEERSTKT
ncbi:large ribosomal subunit protein bL28m [Anabrus simplex]|uniref:large ribosomal subunit protein bL28m n=1 Tax=Anabrus simplex TaxID=316456 RepID=UPI0034DD3B08